MTAKKILFGSLMLLAFGCSDLADIRNSIAIDQSLNSEIIYKTVRFPDWLFCANSNLKNFHNQKPTILTTVSTDCSDCITKFINWNSSKKLSDLSDYNIYFVALGKQTDLLKEYLKKEDKKRFLIIIDTTNTFLRDNNLFSYYQKTLVLDKNHQIVYVGDPINDQRAFDDLRYLQHEK